MSIYAISDLHLSLGSQKSMDIFKGWDNYVEKLKKNWLETITEDDTVIIAGDISWAMKLEEAEQDLRFLNNLPGSKIMLKGNHDYWWSTTAKVNKFLKENSLHKIEILFNSAKLLGEICICGTRGWILKPETDDDKKILSREAGRLRISLDIAKEYNSEPIVFLHYPPIYGSDEASEIINLMIERKVRKCYYGHIHGSEAAKKIVTGNYKGIDFQLISCDYINFCPVLVAL